MITYKIRQQVRTVEKSWMEEIYSSVYENQAKMGYASFVKEHPNEYFELVKIEANEECLAFTPKFD